jgi:hypothetical protein
MARLIDAIASSHTPNVGSMEADMRRYADTIKRLNLQLD